MKSLIIRGTRVYCFDPGLKKVVKMGTKIGDTFFKTVEPAHFMQVVNGYGFQYDAFACFEAEDIAKIEILEHHTGITWQSKPLEWFKHGKIADYGRGKQIFLSLKYMHKKDKEKLARDHERSERIRGINIIQRAMF